MRHTLSTTYTRPWPLQIRLVVDAERPPLADGANVLGAMETGGKFRPLPPQLLLYSLTPLIEPLEHNYIPFSLKARRGSLRRRALGLRGI